MRLCYISIRARYHSMATIFYHIGKTKFSLNSVIENITTVKPFDNPLTG